MRVVLQPLRLPLHRLPILFDEFRKNKLQQPGAKGHPAEKVPASHDIDAAVIACDGRDRGQRREPVFPSANRFIAQVRQNEIDGRRDRVGVSI